MRTCPGFPPYWWLWGNLSSPLFDIPYFSSIDGVRQNRPEVGMSAASFLTYPSGGMSGEVLEENRGVVGTPFIVGECLSWNLTQGRISHKAGSARMTPSPGYDVVSVSQAEPESEDAPELGPSEAFLGCERNNRR